jgi:hypothetical protein
MSHQQQTSLISILSTDHGRLRREERDIEKRDLQKAIKHGTRQRCWGNRWKIEYDGIIFITNSTFSREVTAFPSPLNLAPVSEDERDNHEKAKAVIDQKPELCKSHTVLVVDNSGSMLTHDIALHRDRQVAAYTMMALEFVAEQLFQGTANNSDVVSLVEFDQEARAVLIREPVSWYLFNTLLERRNSNDFKTRENSKMLEYRRSDSNYLPALELANSLLEQQFHDECALAMFFLSDGEPSDARANGWTPIAAKNKICEKVTQIANMFQENIQMSFVGLASNLQDFSTLEAMAASCKVANVKANFAYCEKIASLVGTAVTSLVTSLTETRTSLMGRRTGNAEKRKTVSESENGVRDDWAFFHIVDHLIYSPKLQKLVTYPDVPPAVLCKEVVEKQRKISGPPPFLAINKHHFGCGAERLAFRCRLSDSNKSSDFVYATFIAKETNLVSMMIENEAFHVSFCETQSLASYLAQEFNKRLRGLPSYHEATTPRITFLECSVFVLEDKECANGYRGVLVEKMLDVDRFKWCKWNDNGGGVDGRAFHAPIDLEYEYATLAKRNLDQIIEGDSDDDEDDESDDLDEIGIQDGVQNEVVAPSDQSLPFDYLQAFSHFTYLFTNKKVLVCDLQGIYNTDLVPPTFELTDPAIHYRSKQGRRMVFGRTDKGRHGMQLFLNTHKCTDICKFICSGRRNHYWRTDWRRRAKKKY